MAKRSAAEWAKLVEAWRRSGVDGPRFATRVGVSIEQLRWWKWHLGKRDRETRSSPPRSTEMVRVEVRAAAADEVGPMAAPIEISRGGWVIRIRTRVDVDALGQVLDAIAAHATC